MKGIIKRIARPFWWASAPIRRPLVRKFEAMLTRTIAPLIDQRIDPFAGRTAESLGRIEPHVLAARAVSEFVEARNADPDVSPGGFAPRDPQAAGEFWKAVEALGYLAAAVHGDDVGQTGTLEPRGPKPSGAPALTSYRIIRELGTMLA